jgi:hypothetical protein
MRAGTASFTLFLFKINRLLLGRPPLPPGRAWSDYYHPVIYPKLLKKSSNFHGTAQSLPLWRQFSEISGFGSISLMLRGINRNI